MSRPDPQALSAPFAHRELNGEQLLEELRDLRGAAVNQKHLNDCAAVMVRELRGLPPTEAVLRLKQIAAGRFQAQPELAGLLVRWAGKLRTERDVVELCAHLFRLAAASALLGAIGRGSARLPRGGRR
jgi:hypothetical protein